VKEVKKSIVLMILLSFALIISYGCASKGYVKQQTDPLVDRINKLEASAGQQGDRITKVEASSSASQADAAEALRTARDCQTKGDIAADKAEAAARRSEAAARKAEKAFELHQRK